MSTSDTGPGLYALVRLLRSRLRGLRPVRRPRCAATDEDLEAVRAAVRERFGYEAAFTHFPIVGLCPRLHRAAMSFDAPLPADRAARRVADRHVRGRRPARRTRARVHSRPAPRHRIPTTSWRSPRWSRPTTPTAATPPGWARGGAPGTRPRCSLIGLPLIAVQVRAAGVAGNRSRASRRRRDPVPRRPRPAQVVARRLPGRTPTATRTPPRAAPPRPPRRLQTPARPGAEAHGRRSRSASSTAWPDQAPSFSCSSPPCPPSSRRRRRSPSSRRCRSSRWRRAPRPSRGC